MNSTSKKVVLGLLTVVCFSSAMADVGWNVAQDNAGENSNYSLRTAVPATNGLTKDQVVDDVTLTDEQQHEALVWGLSTKEEKTYVLLMKNQSGVYYKNRQLTPVAILGINATDNKTRKGLASKEARFESQNNAKLLAWVAAESQAIKTVNQGIPNILSFDTSQYDPNRYQPATFKPGDTVMMWTTVHNSQSRIITRFFISQVGKIKHIHFNVYFTDKNLKKTEIQAWAKGNSIPVGLVKNKIITLNVDNGKFHGDGLGLFLVRQGKTKELDVSRF